VTFPPEEEERYEAEVSGKEDVTRKFPPPEVKDVDPKVGT
jgi:hypothetical protein